MSDTGRTMAMADLSEASNEAQLTFKVKTSGDKSHTITMAESAKVVDLKTKLAGEKFEKVPVERQRLIYSGRVMKNDDTLATYKIKTGNTIHMVKSAASNPAPANAASSSASTPPAVPPNMAAGTSASNLLAGLTGARFAGHANLPSASLFGADGGMGAPPSVDEMANMLADPMVAQSVNEAFSNPNFVDMILQTNPQLASLPNAREFVQSPYFRNMLTNPETLRQVARMRRLFGGNGGGTFPAPGTTDSTAEGTGSSGGAANNANNNALAALLGGQLGVPPMMGNPSQLSDVLQALGGSRAPGAGGAAGSTDAAVDIGSLLPSQDRHGAAAATRHTGQSRQQTGDSGTSTAESTAQQSADGNPFAALFGGAAAPAQNPFMPEGLERMAQWMQAFGGQGYGAPAAPQDNRPPEERYAEQLRQLNDMGFYDFDRNVAALRRSGGSVQGAIDQLLNQP